MNEFTTELINRLNYVGLENDYYKFFEDTAKLLMNKFVIRTAKTDYEIIDVEFYLFDKDNHRDIITYPRIMDAGRWFFHDSGVDLTFASRHNRFGGILIRAIRTTDGKKVIIGPHNCVYELWHDFDAFALQSSEYPVLIPVDTTNDCMPDSYIRKITVKESEYHAKVLYWIDKNSKRAKDQAGDNPEYGLIEYDKPDINCAELAELVIKSKYHFKKRL